MAVASFRLMYPATFRNGLRNMTKSSRCYLGLQIPKISIWLSIYGMSWTSKSDPALPHTSQDLKDLLLMSLCQMSQDMFRGLVESNKCFSIGLQWNSCQWNNDINDHILPFLVVFKISYTIMDENKWTDDTLMMSDIYIIDCKKKMDDTPLLTSIEEKWSRHCPNGVRPYCADLRRSMCSSERSGATSRPHSRRVDRKHTPLTFLN